MRQVSDGFLLNMAEVSGALTGLFLVGVFFYVETGFRRLGRGREDFEVYFRASTRIVLLLFTFPLGLSLTLVVLKPAWNAVIFALLSLALVAANVDTAIRVRSVREATGSPVLLVNEIVGTIGVLVLVITPWLLGGLEPTREDFTWAILISFATAFLSVIVLVLSAFDLARSHRLEPGRTGGR
jgi:hypothetical protein